MPTDLTKQKPGALVPQGEAIPGLEGITPDMLIIPRLKIVQKMSVECDEPLLIKPGSIVNSVTKDVLVEYKKEGTQLTLIPVVTGRSRIYFRDMKEGGGILCSSTDAKTGQGEPGGDCLTCGFAQWKDKDDGGKSAPPLCTEFYNVFCTVRGYDYPIPLTTSFGKSSMGAGKQLINLIFNDSNRARLSPWNFAYALSVESVTNEFGTFFVFNVKPGGRAEKEEIETGASFYELISTTKVQIHEDEEEMAAEAKIATEQDKTKTDTQVDNRPDAEDAPMTHEADDEGPF